MRKPRGVKNHSYAPKAWRSTSNITGDYDLDSTIQRSKNKAVPSRLETHLLSDEPYGPRTGYNGYSGYSGDD